MSSDEHFDPASAGSASRSQRKREATRAQELGQRLTELGPGQLENLELSEALLLALREYQAMRSHEARRRQRQFIGKLMRENDVERIACALDSLAAARNADAERFQDIELQRDRLLAASEDALPALLAAYPKKMQSRLSTLIRQAREEREKQHPPHAFRRLFRLLRELEETAAESEQT